MATFLSILFQFRKVSCKRCHVDTTQILDSGIHILLLSVWDDGQVISFLGAHLPKWSFFQGHVLFQGYLDSVFRVWRFDLFSSASWPERCFQTSWGRLWSLVSCLNRYSWSKACIEFRSLTQVWLPTIPIAISILCQPLSQPTFAN